MTSMRKLLLLPVTLPLAAARGALTAVVEAIAEALAGDLDAAPPPAATREPAPPPPPPPARAPEPRPEPPIKIHDDEPTRGEVNRMRLAEREAEGGAVGAEVHVDEPWQGYDAMTARQVLDRLVGADDSTLAVVRLYESATRNRATILRETES